MPNSPFISFRLRFPQGGQKEGRGTSILTAGRPRDAMVGQWKHRSSGDEGVPEPSFVERHLKAGMLA